jgi:hypothetical protein
MATTINRADIGTDDDGSGTTGTIINRAYVALAIYDKIDAIFAGSLGKTIFGTAIGGGADMLIEMGSTTGDVGLALLKGPNPGNTSTETYLAGFGRTSSGAGIKNWSISSHFTDTDNTAGYSCLRLNSTYQVAGAQTDDLSLSLWGGHGIGFFAPDFTSTYAPGAGIVKTYGSQYITTGLSIGGAPSGTIQLFLTGTIAPAGTGRALDLSTTINANAGSNTYGILVGTVIVEAGSGTHAVLAGLKISLGFTGGAATTTNTVGIDIDSFVAPGGIATGLRVAAPTGGATNYAINVTSGDIYKAGSAYGNPAWVFERHYTGSIARFADRFAAMALQPGEYGGLRPLAEVEQFTRTQYELPLMTLNPSGGLAARGELLLAALEEAYLYLFDLHRRLAVLEARG